MSLPKIPNKSPLWLTILVALPLLASYIIFFPLTVWNDIICFFSIVHYIYRVYTCNTLVPFFHLVKVHISFFLFLKGALSGLRQFLAIESPFKMMKNAVCFTSKGIFVLKIFKFLY